ncbi:MAG: hypothetical protein V3U49_01250 [Nitrososphaerales archaeon]
MEAEPTDEQLDEFINVFAKEMSRSQREKFRSQLKRIIIQASHVGELLEATKKTGSKPSQLLNAVDVLTQFS